MPYIPHTKTDIAEMLKTIGVDDIEDLFDEIPSHLITGCLKNVPNGISEMEVMRKMSDRATLDDGYQCYIGAGAYEHHIPAAVWDIAARGELMTAYTPYQAEASQGTLQLIYEFQSMIAHLCDMDISNASLYEGASGLAEAILMAIRSNRKSKSKKVLLPSTVHPAYVSTCNAIVRNQGVEINTIAYDKYAGTLDTNHLEKFSGEDYAALVIAQPNFFGSLEDVHRLTNWAHENKMLVVALVNPTSLALLTPPGQWGDKGADIAVGEGQALGVPLSSGGPYYGFMCCRKNLARQIPGRIIGRTVDLDGKEGYTLTLQAREQHIRRSKATSNICTNQGWAVTASTMYMSLLGADGLKAVATDCMNNAITLKEKVCEIEGVEAVFSAPHFHEFVVKLDVDVKQVLDYLEEHAILGGLVLSESYSELDNHLLICVTETKTSADLDRYVQNLNDAINHTKSN